MSFPVIAVIWLLVAAAPALIARENGRSFGTWYLYGLILLPLALLHSLRLSPKINCPKCRLALAGRGNPCYEHGVSAPPPVPETLEACFADLQNIDPVIRETAMMALIQFSGQPEQIHHAVKAGLQDPQGRVRARARFIREAVRWPGGF